MGLFLPTVDREEDREAAQLLTWAAKVQASDFSLKSSGNSFVSLCVCVLLNPSIPEAKVVSGIKYN